MKLHSIPFHSIHGITAPYPILTKKTPPFFSVFCLSQLRSPLSRDFIQLPVTSSPSYYFLSLLLSRGSCYFTASHVTSSGLLLLLVRHVTSSTLLLLPPLMLLPQPLLLPRGSCYFTATYVTSSDLLLPLSTSCYLLYTPVTSTPRATSSASFASSRLLLLHCDLC